MGKGDTIKIDAIAIVRSASAPANPNVLWWDTSAGGSTLNNKIKVFDTNTGKWAVIDGTSKTGKDLLEEIKKIDGEGSGIDADMLDGYHASAFLRNNQGFITQTGSSIYGLATGTDTYAVALTPAPASLQAGMSFNVSFTNANTGAATLNVNGLGAKAIVRKDGTALAASEIPAGSINNIVYDGTSFQIGAAVATVVLTSDLQDVLNAGSTASIATDVTVTTTTGSNVSTLELWSTGGTKFRVNNNNGTYQSEFYGDGDSIFMDWNGQKSIALRSSSMIVTDSTATPKGLEYGGAYKANFTTYSLVDKDYVDTQISASGLAIGNAISGGAANRVLFEDVSNNLGESQYFIADGNEVAIGSNTFDGNAKLFIKNASPARTNVISIDDFSNVTSNAIDILMSGASSFKRGMDIKITNTSATSNNIVGANIVVRDSTAAFAEGSPSYYALRLCASMSTRNAYGLYVDARQSNSGENIGIYVQTENAGAGGSNALQIVDGTQGAGKFLQSDANGKSTWAAINQYTGLTIGDSITSGGANRILFEDGSNNLASDANFYWTGAALSIRDASNNETDVRASFIQNKSESDDANLYLYGYGTDHKGEIVMAASNGTIASPTALLNGNKLATIDAFGHSGTSLRKGGSISFSATENFVEATGYGTRFVLQTTINGATSPSTRYNTTGTGDHQFIGSVGINTDSFGANEYFKIFGSGQQLMRIQSTDNDAGIILNQASSSTNHSWKIYANGDNLFIRDVDAAADRLNIDSSGNFQINERLGIGITPSTTASLVTEASAAGLSNLRLTGGTADVSSPVDGDVFYNTSTDKLNFYNGTRNIDLAAADLVEFMVAASGETETLTTGTGKIKFRMPYAMTLTDVRASLNTAGSGTGVTTIDINEGDTPVSILSTKLTINATEKTSTTATDAVISDANLADDAEISIDIDGLCSGADEVGLKVTLIGYRA